MQLHPTGDTCPFDCMGSRGWQSWKARLVPRRLFSSCKEPEKSVWIHAALHWWLPAHPATWWLPTHTSLPDSFVSIRLPCCKSTQSSKADCKYPAPKICFQWDEGLFTWVALQLWPQLLSLHSSHPCVLPRLALHAWVSLSVPVQPPAGRTAMESNSSSVRMEIMLCSYLGNTGEDLGRSVCFTDPYIQGPQQTWWGLKVLGWCARNWFVLISMCRIL